MEQFVIGVIVFVIAIVLRRREALAFRWQPTRHTWVAIGSGLLAFVFSALLLLFEAESVAARLIHGGLIYLVCGFAIPWGYTLLVERSTLAELGLRRERWVVSLILSAILAALFSLVFVFEADLSAIHWGQFARTAVAVVEAGGLFELFLYYGFIHLRLERAFGTIPAILLTSTIYVSWHTGTQLPLEPDPLAAVVKLFAVGVMIDMAVNLDAVEQISVGFPWAVGTLVLMGLTGAALAWLVRQQPAQRGDSSDILPEASG